jgi:hypothetical protein
MKIFNKENDKEVVYVQIRDIDFLMATETEEIDYSIYRNAFGDNRPTLKDKNLTDFIRYSEESEVDFFKHISYILDFAEYINLPEEKLQAKCDNLWNERKKITDVYDSMPIEEKYKNKYMVKEVFRIDSMIATIQEINLIKKGECTYPLPIDEKVLKKD